MEPIILKVVLAALGLLIIAGALLAGLERLALVSLQSEIPPPDQNNGGVQRG